MAEGDYVELAGRRLRKMGHHYIYHTRGVAGAVTSTGVPKVEDTLSDPDLSGMGLTPKCADVQTDEQTTRHGAHETSAV